MLTACRYYTHYHVHFPLLPELPVFLKSYASFDVLFWTVIAIGCTRSSKHSDLYLRLKNPVERLLTDINHPASHSFPQIQALLLICCWPFPFGPIDTDPSWTYCGLATHYALRLGLHRPAHATDFKYDVVYDQETMIIRQRTWIACFIINQACVIRRLACAMETYISIQDQYKTRHPVHGQSR